MSYSAAADQPRIRGMLPSGFMPTLDEQVDVAGRGKIYGQAATLEREAPVIKTAALPTTEPAELEPGEPTEQKPREPITQIPRALGRKMGLDGPPGPTG